MSRPAGSAGAEQSPHAQPQRGCRRPRRQRQRQRRVDLRRSPTSVAGRSPSSQRTRSRTAHARASSSRSRVDRIGTPIAGRARRTARRTSGCRGSRSPWWASTQRRQAVTPGTTNGPTADGPVAAAPAGGAGGPRAPARRVRSRSTSVRATWSTGRRPASVADPGRGEQLAAPAGAARRPVVAHGDRDPGPGAQQRTGRHARLGEERGDRLARYGGRARRRARRAGRRRRRPARGRAGRHRAGPPGSGSRSGCGGAVPSRRPSSRARTSAVSGTTSASRGWRPTWRSPSLAAARPGPRAAAAAGRGRRCRRVMPPTVAQDGASRRGVIHRPRARLADDDGRRPPGGPRTGAAARMCSWGELLRPCRGSG